MLLTTTSSRTVPLPLLTPNVHTNLVLDRAAYESWGMGWGKLFPHHTAQGQLPNGSLVYNVYALGHPYAVND